MPSTKNTNVINSISVTTSNMIHTPLMANHINLLKHFCSQLKFLIRSQLISFQHRTSRYMFTSLFSYFREVHFHISQSAVFTDFYHAASAGINGVVCFVLSLEWDTDNQRWQFKLLSTKTHPLKCIFWVRFEIIEFSCSNESLAGKSWSI